MEDAKNLLKWAIAVGIGDCRPWKEFFPISGSRFNVPKKSRKIVEKRVYSNLLFYRTNYLFVAIAAIFWTVLGNPSLLFILPLLGALWVYFLVVRKTPILFLKRVVLQKEKVLVLSVLSLALLLLTRVFFPLLMHLGICSLLVLVHALFRQPTLSNTVNRLRTDVKFTFAQEAPKDAEDIENPDLMTASSGFTHHEGEVSHRSYQDRKAALRGEIEAEYPSLVAASTSTEKDR